MASPLNLAARAITGEGSLDAQMLEGKGPAGIASLARRHGKRVVAFAGCASEEAHRSSAFDGAFAIMEEAMSLGIAIPDAEALLERKVHAVIASWI